MHLALTTVPDFVSSLGIVWWVVFCVVCPQGFFRCVCVFDYASFTSSWLGRFWFRVSICTVSGHVMFLTPSNHIKYLGILIDSTLTGKHQCNVLTTKLFKRANGMLSKIRHYWLRTKTRTRQSIYHAIFSSHMSYGCQIWGQGDKENLDKIVTLQNRAQRTINFQGPRTETLPLYASNEILKLEDLIKLNNCLFIHDYLHDKIR